MELKNYELIKDNLNLLLQSDKLSYGKMGELLKVAKEDIVSMYEEFQSKYTFKLDKETERHSINVAGLALFTGLALNLTKEELCNLVTGALIHDIGKCFIDEKVLHNTNRLTEKEISIIKEHPLKGYQFSKGLNLSEDVRLMILDHHEKIDGTGYPANKTASEINYYAKIIAVCDVFEAFSSKRSYKESVDLHVVMNFLLAQRGIQFDTDIVNIFHDSVYSIIDIREILSAVSYGKTNLDNKVKLKLKPILT